MSSPVSDKRRINTDVFKLIESRHKVTVKNDNLDELIVKLYGPQDTLYEGGVWKVLVHLPENYPFKPPILGFLNRIYHPNIDEDTGCVCLDVINQNWSALYDLKNIFETFLPQLLTYPNYKDPLNMDAAECKLNKPETYKKKVTEYVRKYASEKDMMEELEDQDTSSESSVSDYEDNDEIEL